MSLLCFAPKSLFQVSYTTKKTKNKNKRKSYSLCFKRPRCKRRYTQNHHRSWGFVWLVGWLVVLCYSNSAQTILKANRLLGGDG